MKLYSFKIKESTLERLKVYARENDRNVSEVIREAINKLIRGHYDKSH